MPTLTIAGSIKVKPSPATLDVSVNPVVLEALNEAVAVTRHHEDWYDLTTDAPTVVNLGGLSNATVVIVKPVGGKVDVLLTSADGASQVVPCDQLLIVVSSLVPFTAISLTRQTGIEVNVRVTLAA